MAAAMPCDKLHILRLFADRHYQFPLAIRSALLISYTSLSPTG